MVSTTGKCSVWLLSVSVIMAAIWAVAHAGNCYLSSGYSIYCDTGCCSRYSSYSGYYTNCCSDSSSDSLYIGLGVTAAVIILVAVGCFICVKHLNAKKARSGTVRPSRTAAPKPTSHPVPIGTTVHATGASGASFLPYTNQHQPMGPPMGPPSDPQPMGPPSYPPPPHQAPPPQFGADPVYPPPAYPGYPPPPAYPY